jgi:membrane protein required for beta-lactamase induction
VWSGQTEADRHLLIGQAMDNLRHWDNIRWLAPFFFWTICGGVAFAAQDMEQALKLTARLQYLQRIEEEIHERMPVK